MSFLGYPKVIPYTKVEHFVIIRFWGMLQTNRQTDKQTDGGEQPTPPDRLFRRGLLRAAICNVVTKLIIGTVPMLYYYCALLSEPETDRCQMIGVEFFNFFSVNVMLFRRHTGQVKKKSTMRSTCQRLIDLFFDSVNKTSVFRFIWPVFNIYKDWSSRFGSSKWNVALLIGVTRQYTTCRNQGNISDP